LKLTKVGYFGNEFFLPAAGYNAFCDADKKNELTLSSEVFFSRKFQIIVLQFRSPLIKSQQQSFCDEMLAWVKKHEMVQVVNLTSCHSYERSDIQLTSSPFRFLSTSANLTHEFKTKFKWIEMENRPTDDVDESPIFIPGGGFSKDFFITCRNDEAHNVEEQNNAAHNNAAHKNVAHKNAAHKNAAHNNEAHNNETHNNEEHEEVHHFDVSIFSMFCSEGDNKMEAQVIVDHLDKWLQLKTKIEASSWSYPSSWVNFYGAPPPIGIF